ncbi:cell envelope integrity protein TolA [Aquabacterium sp. A08]|uniref:cell envelope integrity protein TolA n=1 Tax=Aquabacterium sp. A08 TaxID=2718532 RepID=UPI00141E54CE|nr:cell envelope integrity protein TolA [Aquabacterium sp. A08]NIC41550.1 cell envelope integrity protein TolA [Aquabacterium sp. A08]NIC42074.1 cell envelope integrity protein TolA [Aquabacterium sp. A08]NIC42123.1 cell envelope integrity protein TolA [Aquabacterium sp. A08]
MQATADTLDLNPPDGGRWRGPLGWALGVHALLVLALTWGVGWQTDTVVVAEAELWSRLPQVAAPKLVAPEPTPAPAPAPKPRPAEPPPPDVSQARRDADIALAQQQKKAREEQARQQALAREAEHKRREQERRERQAQERAAQAKADQEKAAQLARDKAARAKAEAAKQDALLEAERQKNLARMMGQAGATGSAGARGTAQQSSGPSAGYAGKLVARIRPNIVFADAVAGNPRAEVEVRTLPDGTIVGSRLLQSSGHPAWDNAVLRAVERTGKLPQDENGRVPGTLILGFRPQD